MEARLRKNEAGRSSVTTSVRSSVAWTPSCSGSIFSSMIAWPFLIEANALAYGEAVTGLTFRFQAQA